MGNQEIRYNAYEIHPVVGLDENNNATQDESKIVGYDQCDENDPDLLYWSVYGHFPTGGISCIADCRTKDEAVLIRDALMRRLTQPCLLEAALLARSALCPRPPAKSLNETIGNAVVVERAIRAIDRAIAGAIISDSHILIPVEREAVLRCLPDIDSDHLVEVIDLFRERLQEDLLEEHLPELARGCGATMHA